jgi:tetratricopeptide (TPR) repeat protein
MAEGSARLGQYHEALEVYNRHADRLLAADSTKLLATLHTMIAHVRDDAGALDVLLMLLNKAGEATHINEVTELLAHACVKSGNLSRALDLYQMLATSEPQNQVHLQNYQQVQELMNTSSSPTGITPEEGVMIIEELEATSTVIDQQWPDNIAIEVRSAVTDADLFLSYNLPDKALVPLLAVLPQAPRDARLNQRLAALHTRFKRFTEAAVCCRTLESVYHDAGYPDEAMRYGELAARYEQTSESTSSSARRAHASPAAVAPPLASRAAAASSAEPWPVASAATSSVPEFAIAELPVHPAFDSHEAAPADLSLHAAPDPASDWESSISIEEPASAGELPAAVNAGGESDASNPEIAETVEEIRFYLEHFMTEQARAGLEKLESLTKDHRILDPLRSAMAAAAQPSTESEPEVAEINADADLSAEFECEVETPELAQAASAFEVSPHPAAAPEYAEAPLTAEPLHAEPVHSEATSEDKGVLDSLVADLEASLGDSFPQASPAPASASVAQSPATARAEKELPAAQPLPSWPVAAPPVAAQSPAPKPALAPKAAPLATAAQAPAVIPAANPAPPQAASSANSVDLSEMFGELKQELEEEVAAGDDDPETHYNLGVAFREMGLLDEAITELQKVCNSIERGQPFAQPVQTYTWLAQCFLDKGVPQAAIRWYEKALGIPGLDTEARLAINYELGSACETAEDKTAALRHFTDVYGANIDYRDVAQRIQALKS